MSLRAEAVRAWMTSALNCLPSADSFRSIYKEVQLINNGGKAGCGAMEEHSAVLGRLVARQEASEERLKLLGFHL